MLPAARAPAGMPGPLGNKRHAPGVLVEVLLALQAVAADRDAVVGRVEDVRVTQLAHCLEFLQDAADLDVDILDAGELAPQLVAVGPDAADGDLVAQSGMAVGKWMRGKVVHGKGRLFGVPRTAQ